MNFEAIIGLEIHVEMKTKSKMFSSSPVFFNRKPNSNVTPFDMAFPGTMPTVNKQAIINAIRVANAIHMKIDDELWFDRKNYFYSDLPKGYQITQQRRPIGLNGYITIPTSSGLKQVGVLRLHLEEDTCKQLHSGNSTYLDFNRAGVPLLEIVSSPELTNGSEAMEYVEKIRSIVTFLDVSNGKMEEGSLRCDVNVSIRPIGAKTYGKKVEIKNLNSIANIQRAIDYEIKRQESVLLSGSDIVQETRRFDELTKKTVSMRIKTDEVDYRFFTESNIAPISLSKEFIEEAIKTSPELAETKIERYKSHGLNDYDSRLLVSNKEISEYFDAVVSNGANPKLSANWIIVDVQTILNKQNIDIKAFSVTPDHLASLIKMIEKGDISNKQARLIFLEMLKNNELPENIAKTMNASVINDEVEIKEIITQLLKENPQIIEDYRQGKNRVIGFLVGKVIKLTQGKANPALTNKLVIEHLKGA